MACHLVGAKPLSEPMLEYCLFDSQEQASVKINWNWCIFIQENAFEIVICEMSAFFVTASMC